MGIKSLNIFYTKIDRAYFSNYEWEDSDLDAYADSVILDIKTLSLLKDKVVVAVPHLLESEVAKDIILNNPEIIELGIVVPLLPDEVSNVKSYIDTKIISPAYSLYKRTDTKEIQELIDANMNNIVLWKEQNAYEWFITRLITDLENTNSILRTNMMDVDQKHITDLLVYLKDNHNIDRYNIFIEAKNIICKPHEYLTEYIDFIHFLSSAISINAEGFLPQDDLIKYDIASTDKTRKRLSEYEVFYRLFLHIVRTFTLKTLPRSVLEQLSFKDIAQLREMKAHNEFVQRYNSLQAQAKRDTVVKDPQKLVLSLSEIEDLEWELKRVFTDTIVKEVNVKSNSNKMQKKLDLATSIASAITFYGTVESVVEIINNGLAILPFVKLKNNVDLRINDILERLKSIADTRKPSEKSILLDFLGRVSKKYIEYLPDTN